MDHLFNVREYLIELLETINKERDEAQIVLNKINQKRNKIAFALDELNSHIEKASE